MVDFAYTTVTGKIKPLLEKIRTVGVPAKVLAAWLKTVGFTSSNDKTMIGVLKFIEFIDGSNIPNFSRWNAYRGSGHRVVLGEAIRKGYADLFAVYPDANVRSNEELSHVFVTSSSGGKLVIAKTVATFKALVGEADFPGNSAQMKRRWQPDLCTLPPRHRLSRHVRHHPHRRFTSIFKFIFLLKQMLTRSKRFSRVWQSISTGPRVRSDVQCQ